MAPSNWNRHLRLVRDAEQAFNQFKGVTIDMDALIGSRRIAEQAFEQLQGVTIDADALIGSHGIADEILKQFKGITIDADALVGSYSFADETLERFQGVTIDIGELLNDQASRLDQLEPQLSVVDPLLLDEDGGQLTPLGEDFVVAAFQSLLIRRLAQTLAIGVAFKVTGADQTLVLLLEVVGVMVARNPAVAGALVFATIIPLTVACVQALGEGKSEPEP